MNKREEFLFKKTNIFLIFFFLFRILHFLFPRCHSLFYSIPIKKNYCFFFNQTILLSSSRFYYSLFFSFFISLFVLFYSFFQWFVFANFSLSFIWNNAISFSFQFYLYLFCIFHFLKVIIVFFSSTCSHSHIERFGQTCMTKEQSEMLMLYPFARPLIAALVRIRCTYRP